MGDVSVAAHLCGERASRRHEGVSSARGQRGAQLASRLLEVGVFEEHVDLRAHTLPGGLTLLSVPPSTCEKWKLPRGVLEVSTERLVGGHLVQHDVP